MRRYVYSFAEESNKIEGIHGDGAHILHGQALEGLLCVQNPTVETMIQFVSTIQPKAQLRERVGLDVRVGNHYPPRGGPSIRGELILILDSIREDKDTPYSNHRAYESLHPFTDGNGRSGRALWLWQMVHHHDYSGKRLFLHQWYYQSLDACRIEK